VRRNVFAGWIVLGVAIDEELRCPVVTLEFTEPLSRQNDFGVGSLIYIHGNPHEIVWLSDDRRRVRVVDV
jgi:hypothetical protein